jgi:hypothetical protein
MAGIRLSGKSGRAIRFYRGFRGVPLREKDCGILREIQGSFTPFRMTSFIPFRMTGFIWML